MVLLCLFGVSRERMQLQCSRVSNIKIVCKMYIQNKQEEEM